MIPYLILCPQLWANDGYSMSKLLILSFWLFIASIIKDSVLAIVVIAFLASFKSIIAELLLERGFAFLSSFYFSSRCNSHFFITILLPFPVLCTWIVTYLVQSLLFLGNSVL